MNEPKYDGTEPQQCCSENAHTSQPCDEVVETTAPSGDETCSPNCSCGAIPSKSKTNIVIGSIILLAVCCIILFKAYTQANEPVNAQGGSGSDAFAVASDNNTKSSADIKTDDENSKLKSSDKVDESGETNQESIETPAVQIEETKTLGEHLSSLSELNQVAIQYSAVFVYIPANADDGVSAETKSAVDAASETLKARGAALGLFTLETVSSDYTSLSEQAEFPAILVACKGFGMSVVSGEITETKLIEAYLASASSGGCCPSGSSSSSDCS
jgi:hypothetical protein